MEKYLIYSFSGELDDISHLFPNERLAHIASIINALGKEVAIWDRGNIDTLIAYGAEKIKEFGDLAFEDLSDDYLSLVEKEASKIIEGGFGMIFLNLWQGSGFKFSMDLAEFLKTKSDVKIYGIGQKVDWFKEDILKIAPYIDGLILGLGFEAIERMMAGEKVETIPNLILRAKGGDLVFTLREAVTNINTLPLPIYNSRIYTGIGGKIPLYHIALSNQACPGRCTFCERPENYGRKIVRRDINMVIDELRYLMDSCNARYFRIADSTPPPQSLTELAKAIISSGLHKKGIHLSAFSRIDINRKEDFPVLKKAGFETLFFGIESLDNGNLERINKCITYTDIKTTLEEACKADLFVVGSFIFPIPGETKKSMENTLTRLNEIKKYLNSALLQPAGVYPSTDWGRNPKKYGILLSPDYVKEALIYPIKLLIPMRFWTPFPFTYRIMEKEAEDVKFEDIILVFEQFYKAVRTEIGIPGIQDYGLLIAKMLKKDPLEFTNESIKYMVTRDYAKIKQIVEETQRGLSCQ
ncbi:MAG: radical SAM protein [Candidatus Omnitrophica bacterium]|nr:radical SAM protein [Candidatus Omnitrophota bacterium]